MDVTLPATGLVVGLLIGLTGIGGGAVMTPFLILVLGTRPVVAVGTDLVYGAVTKAAGAWLHWRQGTVDMRLALRLAAASVPAGVLAVLALQTLPASTEAADRFEELDRQAKQQRVRPTDPSMQPLYIQTEAKLNTKLAEVLGTDAMPPIRHFANTLFLREAVVQVANDLFYTPTPLTQPQADQLVEVMWKNMRDPFGNTDPLFADASAMKTEAQGVLSAPQLAVWHTFIDHLAKTAFASLQAPARIRR